MNPNSPESEKPQQENPRESFFRRHCCFKRPKVTAGLLYILAIFLAIFYVLPAIVTEKHLSEFIRSYISSQIGAELKYDKLTVSLIGGPSVHISNALVSQNGKPILSAKNIHGSLSVLKALTGELSLHDFVASAPVAHIVRRADGTYNLPILNSLDENKELSISEIIDTILGKFRSVNVSGGAVYWKDYRVSKDPVTAAITKVNISMKRGGFYDTGWLQASAQIQSGGVPASFLASGGIEKLKNHGEKKTGFSGRVSITNLQTGRFWPYLNKLLPFQRLDAVMSLDASVYGNLESGLKSTGRIFFPSLNIRYKEAFSTDVSPKRMIVLYDVAGTAKELNLNRLNVKLGALEASVKGKIGAFDSANPTVDVSISTPPLDVNELKAFLPDNALSPHEGAFLSQNVKEGKIRLADFSYRGDFQKMEKMGTPESLRGFSGQMEVSGVRLEFQNLSRAFEDINGNLDLFGDRLSISGVRGRYGKSALEGVSGSLENIHVQPFFKMSVKAAVNLPELQQIIQSRAGSQEFKEAIGKVDFTEGSSTMDITLSGDTQDVVKTLAVNGKISLDNVTMESEVFGLPIRSLSGTLEGSLADMKLKGVRWKAGSSPFTLAGSVKDILKDEPSFDLNLGGQVSFEDMHRIKFISYQKMYHQTGEAMVKLGIKGTFAGFKLDYALDMTQAEYRLLDIIEKPKGTRNIYTFTGFVRNRDKLDIDKLVVDVGNSRVVVTGKLGQFLRNQGMDLTFETEKADFDDLDRYFLFFDDIKGTGYVSGKIGIYSTFDDRPVKLTGKLKAFNATFKLPILEGHFNQCNGEFELINNKFFLKSAKGKFNNADFVISGQALIAKRPEFTLNITADKLNLYDLFGQPVGENEPAPPAAKPAPTEASPPIDWVWNINAKSASGTLGMLKYTNLHTRVKYENYLFVVEPLEFNAHGGRWRWAANIDLPPDKPGISFTSKVDISDLDMGRFLEESVEHEKFATGKLNLRGEISGQGALWRDMKRSFNGWLEAKSGPGVIKRFNLLSKIFSLLNVIQYLKLKWPDLSAEGMPFTGVTADFTVQGGKAKTKNLMVDSDSMRISAIGDYDIGYNRVDLQVGVMPLVTVDKVISSIPVMGYVLTGEKKGLLAAYFDVKGPLANPEVEAVPLESIAAGIGGILKRFVLLPLDAVKLIEGQPSVDGNKR